MECALFFCHRAGSDDSGQLEIRGIFDELRAPSFPARQPRMRLAGLVSWNDGERGRVPFLIELLDPGEKAVFTIQGFSEVEESPGSAAPPRTQLNLPLEDVTFPEPGRYRIRLEVEGTQVYGPSLYLGKAPEDSAE
ncbi:MAG: hypothetical protein OXI11_10335 [Gammaproteobacteria bacterium]|nr:hypothetical protein [Gammaproteobacteria bacterium]MXW46481.1 hypothetical protein [Gammaproteobacteria bacterium]MYD02152.1 hypothetical protein [Gammaproteobacteria bacterium]MYI24617.1 hypothetical protein [Gammaproteobacteria bacterium]